MGTGQKSMNKSICLCKHAHMLKVELPGGASWTRRVKTDTVMRRKKGGRRTRGIGIFLRRLPARVTRQTCNESPFPPPAVSLSLVATTRPSSALLAGPTLCSRHWEDGSHNDFAGP